MTEAEWLASANPLAMLVWVTNRGATTDMADPRIGRRMVSGRKLRLFAVACCRQVWDLLADEVCPRCEGYSVGKLLVCNVCDNSGCINRSRRAVEVAEQHADGEATAEELAAEHSAACATCANPVKERLAVAWSITEASAWVAASAVLWNLNLLLYGNGRYENNTQAAMLRDVVGNPWKPLSRMYNTVKGAPRYSDSGATLLGVDHDMLIPISTWLTPVVLRIAQSIYDRRAWDETGVLADALEDAGCDNDDILNYLRLVMQHARGCHVIDTILGKD